MGYGKQRNRITYKIVPRVETGWYDVIRSDGQKVNTYPLTSVEAQKMAKC